MDETDIITYRCEYCQQDYASLWALNQHVARDHTTPRDTPILGTLITGIVIALIPAVIIGAIVIWLAWDIKDHNQALIAGMVATMTMLWMGAWIALAVGNAEER